MYLNKKIGSQSDKSNKIKQKSNCRYGPEYL